MAEARIVGLTPGFPGEDLSSLQNRCEGVETYDDHEKLLADLQPDVVLISTRLDLIAGLAAAAAAAGCHTICEKPLALEHGTLRKLWDAVVSNRTQCVAMLPNRAHPVLAAAKVYVDAGRIGEVKLLNARKSYKLADSASGWLGNRATYGGTLPWVGIHALDFIAFVSGTGFRSVSALHANVAHPLQSGREDICTMSLSLRNGALATVSIDYLRPLTAATHGDDWLRIVGTEGSIEAAMARGYCTIIDSEGIHEVTEFAPTKPFYAPLLRNLLQARQSAPTAQTRLSFALTHTALCARDAADQRRTEDDLSGPWDVS